MLKLHNHDGTNVFEGTKLISPIIKNEFQTTKSYAKENIKPACTINHDWKSQSPLIFNNSFHTSLSTRSVLFPFHPKHLLS